MATGEIATRVEVDRNKSGSQSSAVANIGNNDRARRHIQDVQANSLQLDNRTFENGLKVQSPRTNVASSVEVPRGGENQQLAQLES